jgi:hypothetical protein
MDIKEIKKIIKGSTSVLVLDDGEPSFVVLDYKAYKDLISDKVDDKDDKVKPDPSSSRGNEREVLDRLNKDILALKDQIEAEEKAINQQVVD